jgi:hypothetical protein
LKGYSKNYFGGASAWSTCSKTAALRESIIFQTGDDRRRNPARRVGRKKDAVPIMAVGKPDAALSKAAHVRFPCWGRRTEACPGLVRRPFGKSGKKLRCFPPNLCDAIWIGPRVEPDTLSIGSGDQISVGPLENVDGAAAQDMGEQSGLEPVAKKVSAHGEGFRQRDSADTDPAAPRTCSNYSCAGACSLNDNALRTQFHIADSRVLEDTDTTGSTGSKKTPHDMPWVDHSVTRIEHAAVVPDLSFDPEQLTLLSGAPGES